MGFECKFEMLVSYYHIAIFDTDLGFNDWRDAHGKQGFSWRPGSVSFGTLDITTMAIHVLARSC